MRWASRGAAVRERATGQRLALAGSGAACSQRGAAALVALLLTGCSVVQEPVPAPRYHLGEPYLLGGQWSYPREDLASRTSGIAETFPESRPPRRTLSGEIFRSGDLSAAHRTMQLPAVVAVTNLETGRTLRLRVIERGPERAGRVIAVSARAAALLGAHGPFRARVEVEAEASLAAIEGLAGRPEGPRIAAAPAGRVEREALAPPPGARGSAGPSPAAARLAEALPRPPEQLRGEVRQGPAEPGRLLLEGSTFFRRDLALRQAAAIPGSRAEAAGPRGGQQPWRVVAGPFGSVAEADAALARAMAAGLQELRLIVE